MTKTQSGEPAAGSPQSGCDKARNRLVRRFFAAGIGAAVFWIITAFTTSSDRLPIQISDAMAHLIWDFERITFPFVLALPLVLSDVEKRTAVALFVLAIAALMNGGLFALAGVIVWYSREAARRLSVFRIRRTPQS